MKNENLRVKLLRPQSKSLPRNSITFFLFMHDCTQAQNVKFMQRIQHFLSDQQRRQRQQQQRQQQQ